MRLILVCFWHPFPPTTLHLGPCLGWLRPSKIHAFINGSHFLHANEPGSRQNSNSQLNFPVVSIITVLLTLSWRHGLDEGRSLLVVRPLVLQPLPVAGDAGDLLAVKVRHRVSSRRVGRVNTVLLDPGKELALLLYHASFRQPFIPLTRPVHHRDNKGKEKPLIYSPQSWAPYTCA